MPFTIDQFYAVFAAYNHAVWPAQYVLFVLALLAVYFAALPSRKCDRIAAAILAFLWLWTALAYHLAFFSRINSAAPLFAAAFLLQSILLWRIGVVRGGLKLHPRNDLAGWSGGIAIIYALLAYPLLSMFYGHLYPQSPTFGAPCPTTIFTVGLLLWAQPSVPRVLLVIPALWAAVGTVAAAALGMPADYALPAVVAAAAIIAFAQTRTRVRLA